MKSYKIMKILGNTIFTITLLFFAYVPYASAAADCIADGCGTTMGCDAEGDTKSQARARATNLGVNSCRRDFPEACPKFERTSDSCTQLQSGKFFCAVDGKCKK